MLSWKLKEILVLASVCGGFLLTLISGFYVVKPFILDAEMVYYGFPLAWFESARGGLLVIGPWHHYFLWHGFIIDLILYGSLVAIATRVYFMSLLKK